MREPRKPRGIHPVLKGFGALILISILLITGTYAVRFCLGLFMVGDQFILAAPGETRPTATEPVQTPDATAPTEGSGVQEVGRATVLATGDLMMHMPTVRSGYRDGTYDYEYIFGYIKDYVSAADYAVVNLETTLSGTEGRSYTGYPKFNSPDAIARGAKSGGFDMLLTANNHCYDYGTQGLLRTLEVIRGANLDTLGTYAHADEQRYVVKELGGIKVGMINYTYGRISEGSGRLYINEIRTDSKATELINVFDYDMLDQFYADVENQISAMKASGAEAIVLFIHWGDEYTTKISDEQRTIARKMCDLGVDVIAGSHPHVVQSMELLQSAKDERHRTVVLYSMGNFLSNQRADNIALTTGQSEDSLLFSFTFVKYSDGRVALEDVKILPTWVMIRGSGDDRTYHILPLDKSVEDWAKTYDLSGTQSASAHESYSRTMDTLGKACEEVRAALTQQQTPEETQPETETMDPGVG